MVCDVITRWMGNFRHVFIAANIYMQARHQSNRKNIDSRFYGSTQCVNNGSGNTPGIEIHSESHKVSDIHERMNICMEGHSHQIKKAYTLQF